MKKISKIKTTIYLLSAVAFVLVAYTKKEPTQQINAAPKVRFSYPSGKDRFKWNSLVTYKITVEDKEDGNSAYNEITANEVFLQLKYFADSNKAAAYIRLEETNKTIPELSLMRSYTCFNCHAIKTKLIGPSFEAIALKYPHNQTSYTRLAEKIIKGSKSVWGSVEMPAHPDLNRQYAIQMAEWICTNASDTTTDYLPGLEGAFRTKNKPAESNGKAVYVLKAFYKDHGIQGDSTTQITSQQIILLRE